MIQRHRVLLVAHGKALVLVVPQAVDQGDPVAGVQGQLSEHIAAAVVTRFQTEDVAHVPMRIDQTRNQRLAADVDDPGFVGNRYLVRRTHRCDVAVGADQDAILYRGRAGAVDDAGSGKGQRAGGGSRRVGNEGAAADGQGQQEVTTERCAHDDLRVHFLLWPGHINTISRQWHLRMTSGAICVIGMCLVRESSTAEVGSSATE